MSGLYITRFIDKLQQLDLKGAKEFVCPIQEAKNLHSDITKLLLELEHSKTAPKTTESDLPDSIQIEVDGGSF
jgi:hypothetical protein